MLHLLHPARPATTEPPHHSFHHDAQTKIVFRKNTRDFCHSLKKKKQQTPHIMFVFCSNKRAVMLMANMRLSFFFSLRCYTDVQLNIDSFFHCCSIACLGATICIEQYSDTVTSSYYSAISGEYVCNMSKKLYVLYTHGNEK